MNIQSIQCFSGRNIYSHKPVVKMVVDLEDLSGKETKDIAGFNERLVGLFPGLRRHFCSPGFEGGFLKRLEEGTYPGHVIEHLALELQNMVGYDVAFGKTRMVREPSVYSIVFEHGNERCGIECAREAVDIVSAVVSGSDVDVSLRMNSLKRVSVESELGPSTRAVFNEARRRGIPVTRVGSDSMLQLGYGRYLRVMEASLTDSTNCIAVDTAGNKQLTKQILSDHGIPVPMGDIAYTEQSAVLTAGEIGYPVVLKPYDGNQGKGVAINIRDEAQLREAWRDAIQYSKAVIVEKYIRGRDYRVLVVGGKVSAVSERRPPQVIGDGIHTIKELVELENRDKLRGDDHEKPLTKIKLDAAAKQVLTAKDLDEEDVPACGEIVVLRENGNLSTGGTARNCTDEIHPYNSQVAVGAAQAIGLDIAGIDITAEDISQPISHGRGAVIEVNAAPGLRMHLFPTEGKPDPVASDILDMLYPEGKPFTVPIIAVTGTNGKTTTVRLIRHVLSLMSFTVGLTSTSGIYIGDECILEGDNTGPVSARMVLSNRKVEAAVLETARGGIVKRGLGYDLADVGVITNISDDHLGQDGIHTPEDMVYVKSLVIEAVKPEGYAVLNADDRMVNSLLEKAKSRVILFSGQEGNLLVKSHIRAGGKAAYVKDNAIWLHGEDEMSMLVKIKDIPVTFGGAVACNIENTLAAAAALYALGIPENMIRRGLMLFKPDIHSNPGRFNLFDMGGFRVMLDYGHNPAGYRAVAEAIRQMNAARYVGIIGMPGDRPDRSYVEAAEICSKAFSRIYIKEDADLRGRKPGEVAEIFYRSVLKNGTREDNAEVVRPELKALEKAILDAQPGDLIVMFYEKFKPAVELIEKLKYELEQNLVQPAMTAGEYTG